MKRGFTLIELLVVIAIIGILSSVVLASLNTARLKSRDVRRVADIKQLQLALALYYDSNSAYPTTLTPLTTGGYIAVLPTDPVSRANYSYSGLGVGATCSSYHLGASIEDLTNQALQSDGDFTAGVACTGSPTDFSGLSAGIVCGASAGTAQPGGTETCYDVKP
ncbi:prepilin-type N-terminal cleavage/methylation domain-containing protein [Candidatus Kaiserbacteria bacterium]|nr:prepilin-type N-terminal cleavage/methylation domain-containing protein [Candidatus Kaiserbacteria bacterium]